MGRQRLDAGEFLRARLFSAGFLFLTLRVLQRARAVEADLQVCPEMGMPAARFSVALGRGIALCELAKHLWTELPVGRTVSHYKAFAE